MPDRESNLECKCEVILIENDVKVFSYIPRRDKIGKYISFCDCGFHRGILGRNSEKHCIKINCPHYQVFREDKDGIAK
ncbi:MAG: hypothetical protein M1416_00890 [Candidatus Pacearchaeota archaeon]|nr:hypothetical protein [Candidatus Pacearchaeota archaeon]